MNINISTIDEVFRIGKISVSNTNVWTVIVMGVILLVLMYLKHDMKEVPETKRQVVCETLVTMSRDFVKNTMGEKNVGFAPYFFSLAAFLLVSNLSGFLFLNIVRPPTADLATTFTLGVLTFIMTQFFAVKSKGVGGYVKSFFEPVFFLFPINIIGEFANPVSLGFRLFGNMTGGLIIITLAYSVFVRSRALSMFVFFMLLAACLYIRYGRESAITKNKALRLMCIILMIPSFFIAFCHGYFDIFSGCLQTLIFCMLSMIFISSAME